MSGRFSTPQAEIDEATSAEDVQVARCLRARGVPPLDVADCCPTEARLSRGPTGVGIEPERFHVLSPGEEVAFSGAEATENTAPEVEGEERKRRCH